MVSNPFSWEMLSTIHLNPDGSSRKLQSKLITSNDSQCDVKYVELIAILDGLDVYCPLILADCCVFVNVFSGSR